MENKKRVILIDAGNIQFRSIFNFLNQPNRVPCTYTFLRMIIGYCKKLKVTWDDTIILALDYGSWRKTVDKNYKAQRKDYRESIKEKQWWEERYKEFNDLYSILQNYTPFHVVKTYNLESDDWASGACRYFIDKDIILVSSDRDWEQLAHYDNVKIFSPISKKFKEIKNPLKILAEKIQGDISDNLLEKPSSEAEWEKREKIVTLLKLPDYIETTIKEEFSKINPKNLKLYKVPYRSIREELEKLFSEEDKNEEETKSN